MFEMLHYTDSCMLVDDYSQEIFYDIVVDVDFIEIKSCVCGDSC